MNIFLILRDKCKELYAGYDIIFRPVLKFGLAVLTFMLINNELGYMSMLNNLFVLIILAVICAILPLNGMVLIGVLLIVAHCFGLGVEVGGFAVVLYLLMMLLYFRFVPRDALSILMTPVAFAFRIPVAVPLCLGQVRGPVSAFSVACGIVSWEFIRAVHITIEPLKNIPDVSLLDVLKAMPNAVFSKETVLEVIIFVVVLMVVTAIRRLDSNYAHEVGIISGAVVYVFLQVMGGRILNVETDLGEVLLGTLGALLIAFFLKVFYYSADYKSSEQLLFEDDRFYYRVKVIPKLHPIDSRTGEALETENDEEMPDGDPERFRQMREEEIDRKFRGIDLQSRLEKSLNRLNEEEPRQKGPEETDGQ